MLITLIRTGGIIPMVKKSQKEVDWSEDEVRDLLKVISESEDPGQKRDATGYQLMYNAGTFSIDPDKAPAKYKQTLEDLKDNLAIAK